MKAVDFFCGSGGLTKGLSNAGVDVRAGIDIDESFRMTYEKNNPNSKFIQYDIKNISFDQLQAEIPDLLIADDQLLFAGCAPCQAFSQQRKSDEIRPDADVLSYFGKFVEHFLPGQVFVENVRGIQNSNVFTDFVDLLEKNGYQVWTNILNAKDFGVPQNRKRLVLIAMRGISISEPKPTHGKGLLPYVTVRTAIGHFTEIDAGGQDLKFHNHVAAILSGINLERIKATPKDGGSRSSWPDELKLKCHKNTNGYSDVYGRMKWNSQSPTITCKCNSLSNGRYGHPEQNRAISLREAAALQTFPDDYVFCGNQGSIAKQIGNAVPVKMAEAIGKHIFNLRNMSSENKKQENY